LPEQAEVVNEAASESGKAGNPDETAGEGNYVDDAQADSAVNAAEEVTSTDSELSSDSVSKTE
jgi:hypothetical protein